MFTEIVEGLRTVIGHLVQVSLNTIYMVSTILSTLLLAYYKKETQSMGPYIRHETC